MNNMSFEFIILKLFWFSIIKLSVEVFIVFFGIFGNVLVVVVVKGLGKKKMVIDFYFLNLVIVDFGILLILFLLVVIKENVLMNWFFGEFVCFYLFLLFEIFYGIFVWFIVVIVIV